MEPSPTPAATRREGVAARPSRLADGNEWGFALPCRLLSPSVVKTADPWGKTIESIIAVERFGYPLEIRRRLAELGEACLGEPPERQFAAFLSLAAGLLRRAHDVDPETAVQLLAVADDDLPRLVHEVMAVVAEAPVPSKKANP